MLYQVPLHYKVSCVFSFLKLLRFLVLARALPPHPKGEGWGELYECFNLKAAYIADGEKDEKEPCKRLYSHEVVYSTPYRLECDILKHLRPEERGFHTLLMDEVDNLVIDCILTSCRLSRPTPGMVLANPMLKYLYLVCDKFVDLYMEKLKLAPHEVCLKNS